MRASKLPSESHRARQEPATIEKMKEYRARMNEWETALSEATDRNHDISRSSEKYQLKYDKLKALLKRAKNRIAKLENDRENLRKSVSANRWREAQLAEQAATQAEIQVRCRCCIVYDLWFVVCCWWANACFILIFLAPFFSFLFR